MLASTFVLVDRNGRCRRYSLAAFVRVGWMRWRTRDEYVELVASRQRPIESLWHSDVMLKACSSSSCAIAVVESTLERDLRENHPAAYVPSWGEQAARQSVDGLIKPANHSMIIILHPRLQGFSFPCDCFA